MPLLVARAYVAEAVGEGVGPLHAQQGVGGMLAAHEAPYGHTHVVVHHAVRHAVHDTEAHAVRLKESERVLMGGMAMRQLLYASVNTAM